MEYVVIIGFLAFILLVAVVLQKRNDYILRQNVQRSWGHIPAYRATMDHEDSLETAWKTRRKARKTDSEVDDITWYDLDLFNVFELLNGTYSSVGSEALYRYLRTFSFSDERTDKLEVLKNYFRKHPEVREQVQFDFAKLGKQDNNFVEQYISESERKKLAHSAVYNILAVLPIAALLLALFKFSVGMPVLVVVIMVNTITYLRKKSEVEIEIMGLSYLVGTIATARKLEKRGLPYQEEITRNLKELNRILIGAPSFRVKSGSEADFIMEIINAIFLLPLVSYNFVLAQLETHQQEAINLWEILGEIEIALGVLNFEIFMPLVCKPTYTTEKQVMGDDIYHPLLKEPVTNEVDWSENTLVTGSNASGKSTYVKSIAINAILGQTLGICCGLSFTMPRSHVLTSMALEDDIFAGESYFIAEIKSVKRIIEKVETGEFCLCFVDEILKGTNTIERIAASASILNWLNHHNCLTFVATHDIELTEIMDGSCANVHFSEQVTDENGVEFDYILHSGPAKTRNAIQLLDVMKYPPEIVAVAKSEAQHFDEERSWRSV